MGIRGFFADLFDRWGGVGGPDPDPGVNPATGLPMADGAVDVQGNPFGIDLHRHDHHDHHHHGAGLDDHWTSSSSPSSHDASSSWPDHFSSEGGYDPSRGW